MPCVLGIDVGSTNCKALLMDPGGQVVAVGSCPMRASYPSPGWAVYEAREIWEAVVATVAEVLACRPDDQPIEGVAVASMGESGVPLDGHAEPLYPVIAWYDQRTLRQARQIGRKLGRERIFHVTGMPLNPMYSANKLLWIRQNEPAVFAAMRTWLCVSDYVLHMLSGEHVTDYTMASRTMMFDVHGRTWWQELLDACGIPRSALPDAVPSGTKVGVVSGVAALRTGLRKGTPVVTGGHDTLCGALGAGVIEPGTVLDCLGTSEGVLCVTDGFQEKAGGSGFACEPHVVPDRYVLLGSIPAGGLSLEWFLQQFASAKDEPGRELAGCLLQEIMKAASEVPPGARGLLFLPHLRGSVTPVYDPESRGAYVGVTSYHSWLDFLRATLEGACFELRRNVEKLESLTGAPLALLKPIGRGTESRLLLTLRADVLGKRVVIPQVTEAVARGAAILAGVGAGLYQSAYDIPLPPSAADEWIEPDPALHAAYTECYEGAYRVIYSSLRRVNRGILGFLRNPRAVSPRQQRDRRGPGTGLVT